MIAPPSGSGVFAVQPIAANPAEFRHASWPEKAHRKRGRSGHTSSSSSARGGRLSRSFDGSYPWQRTQPSESRPATSLTFDKNASSDVPGRSEERRVGKECRER